LLDAVTTHGTSWTTIVKSYFPGRTALAAKNRYSHLSRSSHPRRGSSPSSSTSSSADASEVSSPVSIETTLSNTSPTSILAEDAAKRDPPLCGVVDQMDFLIDDAAAESPPSSSPSSPSDVDPIGSESKTCDNQILERFLNSLASDGPESTFSEFKIGEFSFPDHFLTSETVPMVQELFSPSFDPLSPDSECALSNMPGVGETSFTLDAEPIPSLWPQVKDPDTPAIDIPTQRSTNCRASPALSFDGNPFLSQLNVQQGSFHPDQQIAVAVAICRADNLRPTVQILIQSLAGALAQPVAPSAPPCSSTKT